MIHSALPGCSSSWPAGWTRRCPCRRLRLEGRLHEVRAEDLRFAADDATTPDGRRWSGTEPRADIGPGLGDRRVGGRPSVRGARAALRRRSTRLHRPVLRQRRGGRRISHGRGHDEVARAVGSATRHLCRLFGADLGCGRGAHRARRRRSGARRPRPRHRPGATHEPPRPTASTPSCGRTWPPASKVTCPSCTAGRTSSPRTGGSPPTTRSTRSGMRSGQRIPRCCGPSSVTAVSV
jgi:hypothetical protein